MPDASTPLTEDNIAEALQLIKDAQPQKRADIVQVFALRLDAANELSPTSIEQLSPGSIDAVTLLIPSLLASPTPTLLTPVLLSLIPAQIKLIGNNDATVQKDRARLMVQTVMSPLLEKMNDAKDRVHLPAVDNVTALGLAIYSSVKVGSDSVTSDSAFSHGSTSGKGKERETVQQMFERLLVNAMEGKTPKGKIGGMKVVVGIREKSSALGLRLFMPLLAGYLEDSDSGVREGARNTLIALLSSPSTPLSARTELKKLMQSRNIKTTFIEGLLDQINKAAVSIANGGARPSPSRNVSGATTGNLRNRTTSTKSTGIMDDVEITPVYVRHLVDYHYDRPADQARLNQIFTERELESEFSSFLPAFEGKETEHNWLQRERAIERVRGMLASGVHRQFPSAFINISRSSFLSVSTKALASLRTTLSVLTIGLYNDLIQELGTAFDPLVDSILPSLAKLSGATKKITAENSQNTIGLIIKRTTCPPRTFIAFLSVGVHEKAAQVRGYYARHLRDYLEKHNASRNPTWSTEHIGSISEMLKHLLGDGTPAVRETARQAFWTFNARYQDEAKVLSNSLDDNARKLLEKARPAPVQLVSNHSDDMKLSTSDSLPQSVAPHAPLATQPTTAAAVQRERKPVSSLMAEMKKKKLAAMRAQAAKRMSLEDVLLPESDDSNLPSTSSVESLPSLPSPPSKSRPSAKTTTKSPLPSAIRSPPQTSRMSLRRSSSSASSNPKLSPSNPTRVPLPPTPILVDLNSKRDTRSSRQLLPQPVESPFEDVFTAAPPANPLDTIQADLASLDFGLSDVATNEVTTQAANIAEVQPINGDQPWKPLLPLALVAPSISKSDTASSDQFIAKQTDLQPRSDIRTSPQFGSIRKTNGGEQHVPQEWDAAAQSYRTPPYVDCAFWLTAVRKEESIPHGQDHGAGLTEAVREAVHNRRISADVLHSAFVLLHCSASELTGRANDVRDIDGVRRMFKVEADSPEETELEDLITKLIEVTNAQLKEADHSYLEAYLLVLWEVCIRHRTICNHLDRQIVNALFEIYRAEADRTRRPIAALLAIWGQMTPDPLDLLLCETAEMDRRMQADDQKQWKLLFFGTLAIAVLVLRLPGIVLKEQVPKVKNLIVAGMGASNIAARQAATVLIVAMEANIRDQTALFQMLPGLTEQQKDLAAYMIMQDLPDPSEEVVRTASGVEGGLSKALRRLSVMKL